MINRPRRWFCDPIFLLALTACLGAFIVQSGELGTADTMHRLQTAHSFWTSEPPVFPNEYPEFGVHGRGGRLYDWYGIGQPLLMLPIDIAGTFVGKLPIFDRYDDTDPTPRNIVVTYSTNILVTLLTALVCFRFLRMLQFTVRQSVAGVLALLFCTTHLHYMQNMMENNYIMLLTLIGFTFQYEWLRTGNKRSLLIGSAALGLNLLTRLTTGLDLVASGIFLLLVMWFERASARTVWVRFLSYAKTAFPVYTFFFLIDRLYQFYRFGTWFDTYVHYFTIEHRLQDPTLPPNYPFETPFHVGFLGPLFTPEKSIFLFDPLIILTILIVIFAWRRFSPGIKAYVLAVSLLLLAYISFYARYTVWSGDFAWGDRYVSTAVEFVAFISVPLLLRYREQLGKFVWSVGIGLIAISAVIQVASLAFWLPLEIYQMETFGHPTWVIALRFKNIVAFALGKMDAWGLNTEAMTQDSWDYVHITTWNFLPFVLRRVGQAPHWVVRTSFTIWIAGLAALAWTLHKLRKVLDQRKFDFSDGESA
ncbi:MAG TPA: hypothetical protein VFA74_15780 [Terriglobales bacterium]|nr:hypothetical protein [Terriglobales bacterium]